AYPTVRSIAPPTAHPSTEAWPALTLGDDVPAPASDSSRTVHTARRLMPVTTAVPRRLGNDAQNDERVAELQTWMTAGEAASDAGAERSLVIVPSRTIEKEDEPSAKAQAFEERLLCSLLELRDPDVRMIYVTSSPIAPSTRDYYLSLLPRRIRRHARSR